MLSKKLPKQLERRPIKFTIKPKRPGKVPTNGLITKPTNMTTKNSQSTGKTRKDHGKERITNHGGIIKNMLKRNSDRFIH